ncbi:SulP family inorganic anion transporter [Sulfurovum sp. XGS-02]|uniref:SulP family inorganic anion transporter n=1 Tax=Sulfurovum sp. XGS-02 TaxID=2925411 RepID=UPI00205C5251|nr:SulP family inorganic anion transporter [Sulfurovum sp. XGS-02]UPT78533.1 SulP family inorganic anion transporter [Sulfurovum sp. XGS-02]
MFNLQNYSTQNIKNDILSGALVAVALVPEAIAFSFIAGVSPVVGLYGAFIIGLITALLGGKPGMISGATGSVAVVFVGLGLSVKSMYPDLDTEAFSMMVLHYILLTSIIAGLIQIAIGVLKMGKFIRLVPQPALFGFVNGLAIVIAMAQLPFLAPQNMDQYSSWIEIISASFTENYVMYIIVAVTMLTMHFLPKFSKAVPAGLVAIVVLTLITYFMHIDTKTVGNLADLSNVSMPSFVMPLNELFTWTSMSVILPTALIVALVGLIESLLTLSVLDEMGGERGSGNKECIALGIGNSTSGLFGGMAGCAMIGQSVINFTSGGLGRLSSFTAAVLLIILVVSFSHIIAVIPIAVLVGIMFMVSIGTFEFSSVKRLKHMPRSDAFVLIVVTIITVLEDLAVAVIAGIIISALVFAWEHAKIFARTSTDEEGRKIYTLEGPLFFASVTSFNEQFDVDNDPDVVVIDFKDARVMDSSGAEAIDALTDKYKQAGKKLTLRHLSKDCKKMLKIAGPFCTYEEDDPTYKVAANV